MSDSLPTPWIVAYVHGILQARILEWVAIPFSKGSSWPRNGTWVFCIAGGFFVSEPPGRPSLVTGAGWRIAAPLSIPVLAWTPSVCTQGPSDPPSIRKIFLWGWRPPVCLVHFHGHLWVQKAAASVQKSVSSLPLWPEMEMQRKGEGPLYLWSLLGANLACPHSLSALRMPGL